MKPLPTPKKPPLGPFNRVSVPFNTGKVMIGLTYTPKSSWNPSNDMFWLQGALINPPRPKTFWGRVAHFFGE